MATLAVTQPRFEHPSVETERGPRRPALGAALTAALTLLAVVIEGYHPYVDDGGLYLAGVERLLHPSLFPHHTKFVMEQTHVSAFAWIVATIVRTGHLGLQPTLFLLQLAAIWGTLFAAWLLAANCWGSLQARFGTVCLVACWLSLPVAGTSLALADPYLTARSFSTPLALFALLGALDAWHPDRSLRTRARLLCLLALAASTLIHPVMTVYSVTAALLLVCMLAPVGKLPAWTPYAICLALLAFCFAAHGAAPYESPAQRAAVLTREYWFASRWEWYELAGLIAPLAILVWYSRAQASQQSTAAVLARMGVFLGVAWGAVSLLFVHPGSSSYLIARVQPLRAFHIVYLVMLLILGAELGKRVLHSSIPRWSMALLLLSLSTYFPARAAYRHSAHLELDMAHSPNRWVQAFLWIRDNTPSDALFALDAEYNDEATADTQIFRAIAERSALPDLSKDGGVAAMARTLAPEWLTAVTAQRKLDGLSSGAPQHADELRLQALHGTGVNWIVLTANSPTALVCPYGNDAVRVCRLPASQP